MKQKRAWARNLSDIETRVLSETKLKQVILHESSPKKSPVLRLQCLYWIVNMPGVAVAIIVAI